MPTIKLAVLAALCGLIAFSPARADSAKDYNLFVLGDWASQYSDVQGRAAAGGNVTLNGYSVGSSLSSSASGTNTLVVGGNLNFSNGSVSQGNVAVGGTASGGVTVSNGTTTTGSTGGLDFAAESTRLQTLSDTLATYATTGTTTYQYGTLTLTGTSSGLNVFTISGSDLSSANSISISTPTGSQVLINVTGTTDSLSNLGISLSGVVQTMVLYNFYEATSLSISGVSVLGTILAPDAAVSFNNGNINGTLIAGTFSGNGELHNYLYQGTLLDNVSVVPEPSGWVMMIGGFGLIGGMLRRAKARERALSAAAQA